MPSYDYNCPECGDMEITHSMHEKKECCPICDSPLKRMYSPTTALYKTIGFYTTDRDGRLHLKDKTGKLGS